MLNHRLLFLFACILSAAAQTTLIPSVTHLDFQLTYPADQTQPQTFTVTSAGPEEVDVQLVVNNVNWLNWLYFLQSGTRTPATFTVYARSSVSATVATTIQLRSSKGDYLVIPVTLENFPPYPTSRWNISPTTLAFTTSQGANPPLAQLALASNTTSTYPPGYAASAVSDRNWLLVGGDFATYGGGVLAGASTTSTISVSCRCNQLPPGSYTGVVYVIAGSYDGQAFTVPVTLTISPPASIGFSATPTALTFDYQIGGSPPLGQSIAVSASGTSSTFRAAASTQSGTWLTVTPASAATPATISVAVNPTGLSPATYTGAVTLTPASGSPISIPVTLTVRAAAPIAASVSSLTFTYRAGDAAPPAQTVQISGGGPSPTFTIQVPDSASWLNASPASGSAPAAIAISVDPAKLTPGTYQANLTVTGTGSAVGSLVLAVTIQVTAPLPTVSKIVHAASYAEGGVAPGEMLTLFGTNIGPDSLTGLALDSAGKVATSLGGVQVLFDGAPSPLVYVSKTQIAVVAPYELAGRQDTTVQVSWNGQRSNGTTIPVVTTAPGIFTANSSGRGPGAIAHANGSINSPTNPAGPGDTVVVYVTGEGQTSPKGVTGKVTTVSDVPPLTPSPVLAVAVLIDGQPAQFSFAGEAPGFVSGVMQLNAQIPANARFGDLPIVVAVGGNASQNGVTVSVK